MHRVDIGEVETDPAQYPDGVEIVELASLVHWLTSEPVTMRAHDAERFFQVAP